MLVSIISYFFLHKLNILIVVFLFLFKIGIIVILKFLIFLFHRRHDCTYVYEVNIDTLEK